MKRNLLFAAIMVCAFVTQLSAQVPGYVPSTNLKGWWGFDGNGNDATTNNNNFTNYGATLTTDRNGTSNSAYSYNGSTQYMQIPTPSFVFNPSGNFTVSFWMFKPTSTYGIAIMSSSSASGNFIWNCQTSASGNVQFGTNKQGSAWSWAQSTLATNTWEHIVCTFANGAMTLYMNGASVATGTYTLTGAASVSLPLWFGRAHGGNYFSGKLDDLGIWDRVLTAAEITSLYVGCNVATTGQPVSASKTIGANVDFGVSTSNSAVTYQWQSNSSGSFQNVANGGQYSGATTDTLSISAVTMANNGEKFRCVLLENSTCSDTSNPATLTVCGGLVGQPSNQSVNAGAMAKFGTSSSDPSATFQWQLNAGSGYISLSNGAQYSGTTTDTLTIAAATMSLNGKSFRCISQSGTCKDTSNAAVLTVVAIGIEELSDKNPVILFPNPAKDNLIIQVNAAVRNQKFEIVNNVGQVVLIGIIEAERNTLDISKLANGYYFLRVGDAVQLPFSVAK